MVKMSQKQIKVFCIAVAVIFVGSVIALAASQFSAVTGIASAASTSSVGVLDYRQAMQQNPALEKANQAMQAEIDAAKKDFEEKTASMNEQDKQDYYQQTQQRLAQRQRELIEPVEKAVEQAAKEVADAKGLSVVLDKGAVIYGGNEITRDVIAKLQKAK